jgi:hypothetical protein
MLFNRDKIILDLCGGTGAWSKPYADAGYDVRVITLPEHNVVDYIPPEKVYGVLAAPPCTEFSPALETRLMANNDTRKFDIGMNTVNACSRIILFCNPVFWAAENPSGYLHRWLGKASLSFHPWNYGDPWTKRTSLWGKFNMPVFLYHRWEDVPKNDSLYIRPGRMKPSIAFLHKSATKECFPDTDHNPKTDAEFRAITPPGFARAFFEANP